MLSRFEAERQALALMDHPNIAKVLDGGTTEGGRPFFVMEYVKGVPFTRYCDNARLSVAQRLALFVPICQAVQHAHQKGIVHRDLKPSNILVCLYDGVAVPKVIDFGLAKAMHQPLTEHTLHTAHGVMMGTPLYMSPEQAEFNNLDVDTRTDIYALGVILYELLTGTTPLEKQRFHEAAWHEMLRLIKEEEPPRPSARLSSSGSLPSLAAQRRLEPVKLTKLVRGELDWIVMKCLEKDRSRRYDTANGLARDVERYLTDELVEVRPPTATYRLRKLVRKHRIALFTTSAFVGLLIASAGISAGLAIKAKRAEANADRKRIEAEWNEKLAKHNLDLYSASLKENFKAYEEADARATGLQIDQDLEEIRTNPTVGLLRLARTLKMIPKDAVHTFSATSNQLQEDQLVELMKKASEATGMSYRIVSPEATQATIGNPKTDPLRQFGTMALLATGQTYASLLPTITHDGYQIRSSILSSKKDRILTQGADKTARLSDAFTGRQIALLRRADETVLEVGLSPDGATAFTHSSDGVVRFWETKDGAFCAETERRRERIKLVGFNSSDPFEKIEPWDLDVTRLSNDRLLTRRVLRQKHPKGGNGPDETTYSGPVELWDPRTGRFIAEMEQAKQGELVLCDFLGNGKWIEARGMEQGGGEGTPNVFSSENGRFIGKLDHGKYASDGRRPTFSPSGRTAATVSRFGYGYNLHCWDTTTWQLLSITEGLDSKVGLAELNFELIGDDLFATTEYGEPALIYRSGSNMPIAQLPGPPSLLPGDRILTAPGHLFDTRTWRRLPPPQGADSTPTLPRFRARRSFPPHSEQ